jgi:hypothetical protein
MNHKEANQLLLDLKRYIYSKHNDNAKEVFTGLLIGIAETMLAEPNQVGHNACVMTIKGMIQEGGAK